MAAQYSLKVLREKKELTQEELGDKIGVHTQFISNMERGIGPIPPKHFKKLASIFGVNIHAFIDIAVDRYRARLYRRMGVMK